MRNTLIALTTAASIAVLVGCSTEDPGRATTAPPAASSTTSGETSTTGSPSGPDLDVERFVGKECSILTAAQLSQLGKFKEPKVDKTAAGSLCRWAAAEDGPAYRVTFLNPGTNIDQVKKNLKSDPVYREVTVDGYPAVSSDSLEAKANCLTAVGVSKERVVNVQISIDRQSAPEYGKTCDYTEKVAAMVIGNLRG